MSEKIKIICPRCKHEWETTLEELERTETVVYREMVKEAAATDKRTAKYRAKCPVDGTYIILEVEED
jgi:hypothetical protein